MNLGILESIKAQLDRIEDELTQVRTPAPVATGLDASIWADGAMDLAAAEKTFSISRKELWNLMRAGKLPYAVATRERLVPRRWLVQYLEAKQGGQA